MKAVRVELLEHAIERSYQLSVVKNRLFDRSTQITASITEQAEKLLHRIKSIEARLSRDLVHTDLRSLTADLAEAAAVGFESEIVQEVSLLHDSIKDAMANIEQGLCVGAPHIVEAGLIDTSGASTTVLQAAIDGSTDSLSGVCHDLEELRKTAIVVRDVREALIAGRLDDASALLHRAESTTNEIDDLRAAVAANRSDHASTERLRRALLHGGVTDWQYELIDVTELTSCIEDANTVTWRSALGVAVTMQAVVIRDLRLALKNHDWEKVEIALHAAKTIGFEHAELTTAMKHLSERLEIDSLVAHVQDACAFRDLNRLRSLIETADDMLHCGGGLAWQTVRGAENAIADARNLQETLLKLHDGLESALVVLDLQRLEFLHAQAIEVDYRAEIVDQAKSIFAAVTSSHRRLYLALSTGGMTHPWLMSEINCKELADALDEAKHLTTNSVDGRALMEKAEVIYDLRRALTRESWDDVEAAIERAGNLEIARPEIFAAKEVLTEMRLVISIKNKLQLAIDRADIEMLRANLAEAYRLHPSAGTPVLDLVYQGQAMLDQLSSLESRLLGLSIQAGSHTQAF